MISEITIEDLYSDTETFDQKAILYMLKDKIILTRENEVVFSINPGDLKARSQILLYALAKKILKVNQKIEDEAITNAEIKLKTQMNKNTLGVELKRLKDKNILMKSKSGYEIPAFKVEEVLRLLANQ